MGTRERGRAMTNTVAAYLAGFILLALVLDYVLNGGQVVFFLALRFVDLLDWAAFWR